MKPSSVFPVSRGFTMVELMVVVAVMAILLAVAVPSFRDLVLSQKVKTLSSDIATAMVIARSEAIKRNTNVVIAPTVANTWTSGWSVATGATVLSTKDAVTGLSVSLTKKGTTDAVASITFAPNGRPTLNASMNFQLSAGSAVRCVTLDLSGMSSSKAGGC